MDNNKKRTRHRKPSPPPQPAAAPSVQPPSNGIGPPDGFWQWTDENPSPTGEKNGLWGKKYDKHGAAHTIWISPPIYIDARTHSSNGESYGHLVRFRNQDGHERTCILLYSELISRAGEGVQRLFNFGFRASENHLAFLCHYILHWTPATTITAAPSHGWQEERFIHTDQYNIDEGENETA